MNGSEASSKITTKTIARLANVSRGTVDRALNNRPGVNEKTKQRILEIARSLDYKPNVIGQRLSKSARQITIGVILPNYAFYQEILRGIQETKDVYQQFGITFEIIIHDIYSVNTQLEDIRSLEERGIYGLIISPLVGPSLTDKIDGLTERGVPVVTLNSDLPGSNRLCYVGQDNYRSGWTSAELIGKLLRPGEPVVICTPKIDVQVHQLRVSHFTTFLEQYHPAIPIAKVLRMDVDPQSDFQSLKELFHAFPGLGGLYFTFTAHDDIHRALREHRKNHPLHVITHDDLPESRAALMEGLLDFIITQNPTEQGALATKLLCEHLLYRLVPEHEYNYMAPLIQCRASFIAEL